MDPGGRGKTTDSSMRGVTERGARSEAGLLAAVTAAWVVEVTAAA